MTRNFKIRYNPQFYLDIQKAINFYTEQTQSPELGKRFVKTVEAAHNKLKLSALHYQIRYDDIRLLPIPSFPYRSHYRVNKEKNTVFVEAIFHMHENQKEWRVRTHK